MKGMAIARYLPVFVLAVIALFVWSVPTHRGLSVSFLDVGQGDAIFIQSPSGTQILVDGGPDGSVLRELSKKMPFWDRTIDAVIESHPDKDHIAGLVEVMKRYDVGTFLEPGIENDTAPTVALAKAVREEKGIEDVRARRGMRLHFGGGAYADILFPDRDVDTIETNTGSIVMKVVYGDTSFFLSGDSPQAVEKYLTALDGENLKSTVLKAGHHGSKNSSAEEFVTAVTPEYVVYSRGCDNTYGHPAFEVKALMKKLRIPAHDTCEEGTIMFQSDGRELTLLR
jgi:competence protein ComEC